MFELVKSLYGAAKNRLAFEAARYGALTSSLHEASDLVTERPGGVGWEFLGTGEKGHTMGDQLTMVKQARKFFRFDPHARAAVMNMVKYVMGRGVAITPKSTDPRVWYIWREFWSSERNGMDLRQFEIAIRWFRDGNVFLEFFNDNTEGKSWKTTVRFRDPELLMEPTLEYAPFGSARGGIQTDPNDAEKPIAYFFRDALNPRVFTRVAAENIYHIKMFADSDQKTGETFIQPVMQYFTHFNQWLANRIMLNKVRSAIVLIKKISGTSSDVARMAATLPTASRGVAQGDDKKQSWRAGTMLTANAGVDYQMLSANINATDAAEDGRNIKLAMAAGTGQPEYVFGDSSNSNYASTMIAESPFVKEVQLWQKIFECHLCNIFCRVIKAAVAAGVIEEPQEENVFEKYKPGAKAGDLTVIEAAAANPDPAANPAPSSTGAAAAGAGKDAATEPDPGADPEPYQETECEKFYGCDVQWPEIVHRDIKETTDALIAQREAGLISDPSAASTLGLDYNEEVRKQKTVLEQAAAIGNPFIDKQNAMMDPAGNAADAAGANQVDAEAQAIMNDLTDQEKQQMAGMTDKASVAKFLMTRKNGKQAAAA